MDEKDTNDLSLSDLSRNQIDILARAINNIVSTLSDFVDRVISDFTEAISPFVEQEVALRWAATYYPRLYHCAKYSKRLRIQSKNITRIVKLYRKEKKH